MFRKHENENYVFSKLMLHLIMVQTLTSRCRHLPTSRCNCLEIVCDLATYQICCCNSFQYKEQIFFKFNYTSVNISPITTTKIKSLTGKAPYIININKKTPNHMHFSLINVLDIKQNLILYLHFSLSGFQT